MHEEVTNRVLLGRSKSRLPWTAGLSSGRSDLGGEQNRGPEHKGMTALPKVAAMPKSQRMGKMLSADPS